mgnify:FL=1
MDKDRVKRDSFDTMWSFLQIGKQGANVPCLREHCEMLRQLMTQKTAGQRKDKQSDKLFDELDTVMNVIVIEAMCLYLDGTLDKLEKEANRNA